jgi:hypothetical protein
MITSHDLSEIACEFEGHNHQEITMASKDMMTYISDCISGSGMLKQLLDGAPSHSM